MEYLQQVYFSLFGNGNVTANQQGACVYAPPRKIIAFGNVLLDYTADLRDKETLAEKLCVPPKTKAEVDAETLSKLTAEACERWGCTVNPGGSALNTTRILKKLGTDAVFFGAIGEDKAAEKLSEVLQQLGIDARLERVREAPTGQCVCLLSGSCKSLFANIGASTNFSVEHLQQMEQDDSCAFLRSGERKQVLYIEGFFVPEREQVCEYIVQNYITGRRRLAVNLSARYIVQHFTKQLLMLTRSAFFIFGNETEFEAFAAANNCDSIEAVAEMLLLGSSTPKVIVVTKGARGVQVISNYVEEQGAPGEISYQSFNAPRVEQVVDTTGAGDAFVAGFLHAWLEKRPLSECVRIATDVSAKVVTQIGCNLP